MTTIVYNSPTAPVMKGLHYESEDEDFSDSTDEGINVITEKNHSNCRRCVIITSVITITFMLFVLVCVYINVQDNINKITDNDDTMSTLTHYVLPNASLEFIFESNDTITGEFTVNGNHYEFTSVSNDTTQYIEFKNKKPAKVWNGFKLVHTNDSKLLFELFETSNKVHIITINERKELLLNETVLLETFFDQLLCELFVELSVKLGAMGYLGSRNRATFDIHRFAQWIWNFEAKSDTKTKKSRMKNSDWIDISDEFEKVNAITVASNNAGFHISNMEELMVYSSSEYSVKSDGRRSLLGNCGDPFYLCDNGCFGMCGPQCWCWSWVCGDCNCWFGCYAHDYECSCNGYFSYCCLNFFWVRCDGSGYCL